MLKMYSAHDSHWHDRSPMRQSRYMMMTWLATSDWPLDWGWNITVMCSLVPISRISSRQNLEVKTES